MDRLLRHWYCFPITKEQFATVVVKNCYRYYHTKGRNSGEQDQVYTAALHPVLHEYLPWAHYTREGASNLINLPLSNSPNGLKSLISLLLNEARTKTKNPFSSRWDDMRLKFQTKIISIQYAKKCFTKCFSNASYTTCPCVSI